MRSIIRGIPPRSGARIFSEPSNPSKHATSRARFWRRSPSEYGTTARDFTAAVMFPDLPSGFGCVGFGHLIGFDCFPVNAKRPPNSGGEFRRALFARGVGWV